MSNLNLLDGVKSAVITTPHEVQNLSAVVRDVSHTLVDRLEAFEDIISLEVGDTALSRARNVEREFNIRQLYLKYEGDNPTGTQKDRIAFAQAQDAIRRGYDHIVVATCGNYGVAISLAARLSGIHCKVFIPETYHTERILEMENQGAEIIRVSGTYEDTVSYSSAIAEANEWYDANPGGSNTALQLSAYAEIAHEIYDQLRDAPKYVACPVSNGTLLAGVYRGFVTLFKRGKTSRLPIFIAGSSANKNPIVASFKSGSEHCLDIQRERIKETRVNEPLINWHSFDGEEALQALRQSGGYAAHISDRKMKQMSKFLLNKEGFRILPASSAGLIALLELAKSKDMINDRYVAILTAKY